MSLSGSDNYYQKVQQVFIASVTMTLISRISSECLSSKHATVSFGLHRLTQWLMLTPLFNFCPTLRTFPRLRRLVGLKQAGSFPTLESFICVDVNTAMSLRYGPKQPYQDRLENAVLVRFLTNFREVRLWCEGDLILSRQLLCVWC